MPINNQELIRKISEAFVKGDIEYFKTYLTDDIKWNILGTNPIIGKKAVLEVYNMSELESFPVSVIKNIVANGNYVVVESTGKATTKNGKPYYQSYCDVFRFSGDQLQEITTYLDTALSKKAFGDKQDL
jgi:uncharacterized protein